jgi:hypothetical protein
MDLSFAQVGYFITQVALSAASFGVAKEDLTIVGNALGSIFDVKCAPSTIVIPAQGAQLQSICTGEGCPLAANASCALYQTNITMPMSATMSSAMGSATATSSGSATSSSKPTTATSAAGAVVAYPAGVVALAGLVAFLL